MHQSQRRLEPPAELTVHSHYKQQRSLSLSAPIQYFHPGVSGISLPLCPPGSRFPSDSISLCFSLSVCSDVFIEKSVSGSHPDLVLLAAVVGERERCWLLISLTALFTVPSGHRSPCPLLQMGFGPGTFALVGSSVTHVPGLVITALGSGHTIIICLNYCLLVQQLSSSRRPSST